MRSASSGFGALAVLLLCLAAFIVLVEYRGAMTAFATTYASDLIRVSGYIVALIGAVMLWNLRITWEKRREDERRHARQRRLLVAIRAEISMQLENYIAQFEGGTAATRKQALIAGVENAKRAEHSMPIGVVAKENDVFDHIKDELADLPEDVIAPVIKYYQADEYVVELIKAFTAGLFEKKDISKRKQVIEAYFEEGKRATYAARCALEALDRSIALAKCDAP
ncbi:MAG: hypothetical protein AAF755_04310 [Pseudomonadota bacterium]